MTDLEREISLADVMENRKFYVADAFFKNKRLRREIELLSIGMHLVRKEIYRLRMLEYGADEDWVSKVLPDYIHPLHLSEMYDQTPLGPVHYNLRQQMEYLRAELLALVVRLRKTGIVKD